jgi:nucleoside-diphosphate-sugar epimerase
MRLCDKKMDSLSCVGPINIGKEEAASIKEIAEIIIEISGKKINIDYDKSQKTVIWGQLCDLSHTKTILDWEALTPLKNGLKIVYKDIEQRISK